MNGLTPREGYTITADEASRASTPMSSAVSPTGHLLTPGIEISLPKKPGRAKGRYEVHRIEREASGKILLTVFGPLRARTDPRYHYINPSDIDVTHVKTRGNRQ